jgi:hypothetical protein
VTGRRRQRSVFTSGHAGRWSLVRRRPIPAIEIKPRCFALEGSARRPTSVLFPALPAAGGAGQASPGSGAPRLRRAADGYP